MKIVMTGGGSGGHITPILAVAHELKQLQPDAEVVYIGQEGDHFADIVAEDAVIDATYAVRAGKFRRYHGEGWRQLLDVHTIWLNLRDAGYVIVGLWQSFWLLGRIKPDAVFCKGGFIGVPVGLAAAMRRIPYVTHDSDAIPGLANRIISRWAAKHAVALPIDGYPYPPDKTVDVGVPVSHNYHPISETDQHRYRQQLGLDKYRYMVLVTGGGLGAERLNNAIIAAMPKLLDTFSDTCVVHTAGVKHETAVSASYSKILSPQQRQQVIVRDFVNDLYKYSAAADVIVARGGATNFAEFAQAGKACIIVPNPQLTGGHQTKNAEAYASKKAVILITEKQIAANSKLLGQTIEYLLQHPEKRAQLEASIKTFARPDSARELAQLLVEVQNGKKHETGSK